MAKLTPNQNEQKRTQQETQGTQFRGQKPGSVNVEKQQYSNVPKQQQPQGRIDPKKQKTSNKPRS